MGDSPITELDLLLVPLDGSKASLRALAVACEIARRRKTCSVSAVHVIEVPRRLPVEADLAPLLSLRLSLLVVSEGLQAVGLYACAGGASIVLGPRDVIVTNWGLATRL